MSCVGKRLLRWREDNRVCYDDDALHGGLRISWRHGMEDELKARAHVHG
jgi:hypothetical protein